MGGQAASACLRQGQLPLGHGQAGGLVSCSLRTAGRRKKRPAGGIRVAEGSRAAGQGAPAGGPRVWRRPSAGPSAAAASQPAAARVVVSGAGMPLPHLREVMIRGASDPAARAEARPPRHQTFPAPHSPLAQAIASSPTTHQPTLTPPQSHLGDVQTGGIVYGDAGAAGHAEHDLTRCRFAR